MREHRLVASIRGNQNTTHADSNRVPMSLPQILDHSRFNPGYLIGKEWIAVDPGVALDCVDPADGAVIASIGNATPREVDLAVAAARRSLSAAWGDTSPRDRGRALMRWASLVDAQREPLAALEAADTENRSVPRAATLASYWTTWNSMRAPPTSSMARCCPTIPASAPRSCVSRMASLRTSFPGITRFPVRTHGCACFGDGQCLRRQAFPKKPRSVCWP
jgi:hypothetical protein